MKKGLTFLVVVLSLPVLASCGNDTKSLTASSANIVKSSATSDSVNQQNWKLSGTTKAPNGSKIIIYSDYSSINIAESKNVGWAKVKNGKFTAYVDPLTVIVDGSENKYTTSKKYKIHIAALSNYSKKKTTSLSKAAAKAVKKSAKTYTITLSSSQAAYYNSLGDDSSSSKNSSSSNSSSSSDSSSDTSDSYNATEGENNAEKYTYGDFVKSDDWVGKSYHISKAEVLQADEKDGQTVLLVYTDDDPDHTFMVAYDGKTPAVEDDYVDIQGVFSKRQSYDTKIGGSNTVPSLVASKITVTGKDSD
ncbi:hypothetical protein ACX1CG_04565 [Lactiplantibacillus plantarum]